MKGLHHRHAVPPSVISTPAESPHKRFGAAPAPFQGCRVRERPSPQGAFAVLWRPALHPTPGGERGVARSAGYLRLPSWSLRSLPPPCPVTVLLTGNCRLPKLNPAHPTAPNRRAGISSSSPPQANGFPRSGVLTPPLSYPRPRPPSLPSLLRTPVFRPMRKWRRGGVTDYLPRRALISLGSAPKKERVTVLR